MKYYNLKSIIGSQKKSIILETSSDSFFTPKSRVTPYIEPSFSKEDYVKEKPAILLVSAVGASGKTTTAHALAYDVGIPVLDLAKHKPVGDNTLTGILTTVYSSQNIGAVLEGLKSGNHGIIIDGIDEGRSKTSPQGFEAFLDDLIKLSNGSPTTSIVIFGRGQSLISTWVYLADKGVDVGLIKFNPFNQKQALEYIDSYVGAVEVAKKSLYEQARNGVLEKLGVAFSSSSDSSNAFLSFIGYPPVLDAIATLLKTEPNYHRIVQEINDTSEENLEIRLLIKIANFLLDRERVQKALPNFIEEIAKNGERLGVKHLRAQLYNSEEQCARVLSRALGEKFPITIIEDSALNDQYEKAMETWCLEHPFLDENRIRNPVFEAISITLCVLSEKTEYQQLARDYASAHQPTYHLLYILEELGKDFELASLAFNMLIQSCSDYMEKGQELEVEVNGLSWDEADIAIRSNVDLEINLSLNNGEYKRNFKFKGAVQKSDKVELGPVLINLTITLPCEVVLCGHPAIECFGHCQITAKSINFDSNVVVRPALQIEQDSENGLFVDVEEAIGSADTVDLKAGDISIACVKHSLIYPLASYAVKRNESIDDASLHEKFRRLRRILQEFASHSKGGLAKFEDKINHERVLRGDIGRKVRDQLLKEGILYSKKTKFYHIDSEKLASVLGITWQGIRGYSISQKTKEFLRRVK